MTGMKEFKPDAMGHQWNADMECGCGVNWDEHEADPQPCPEVAADAPESLGDGLAPWGKKSGKYGGYDVGGVQMFCDTEEELSQLCALFAKRLTKLENEINDLRKREALGYDLRVPISVQPYRIVGLSLPGDVTERDIRTLAEMLLCITDPRLEVEPQP
jgi:hypothetical protein